jgi:hypothetical protein
MSSAHFRELGLVHNSVNDAWDATNDADTVTPTINFPPTSLRKGKTVSTLSSHFKKCGNKDWASDPKVHLNQTPFIETPISP